MYLDFIVQVSASAQPKHSYTVCFLLIFNDPFIKFSLLHSSATLAAENHSSLRTPNEQPSFQCNSAHFSHLVAELDVHRIVAELTMYRIVTHSTVHRHPNQSDWERVAIVCMWTPAKFRSHGKTENRNHQAPSRRTPSSKQLVRRNYPLIGRTTFRRRRGWQQ